MKITKDGLLYQLAFLPRIFPVNCYLVEEAEGLTLIDAALPYSAKGILDAAAAIGKPITRILLTHAHEDHVGALDSLKHALADVPIYISRRDARLMENDRTLDQHETQRPIKGGVPKKLLARADFLLEEGERIGSLQTIHVPGHTPGSMAFLDVRSRAIVAGDAFQTRAGIAVAGDARPLFPFPAFGTWCRKTALESGKKLVSMKPEILACGHGGMLRDPVQKMEKAIRRLERQIEKGV